MTDRWRALGAIDELKQKPLRQVTVDKVAIALSYRDGKFGAVSGRCNHAGGPLGEGTLRDDGYIVCPWHHWMFHRETGEARPGIPAIVPRHELREQDGVLYVNLDPATKRVQAPHPPHPLTRKEDRKPGPLRLLGLSTTAMDEAYPRYSTSDDLLQVALASGAEAGAESKLIRLSALKFRHCEGLLLEERPRLHLAVQHHPDGFEGRAHHGLRAPGVLGGRGAGGDADPLGRAELALCQDDRAAE
jgi:nitrite reductase/ring-hydroxylating ferredoxin subunit